MIILAAIFYVLLTVSSILLTKDKYNIFLLSNIIFLTTTFLFPFLGLLFGLDVIMTVEGMVLYILLFFIFFIFYILGRKSLTLTTVASFRSINKPSIYIYLVLLLSLFVNILFVTYSVAAYGIQGAFINPREVYTTTRTGSGQIYYVASVFFTLYVLLGLFVYKRKWLHFFICVIFALPYGTKGKIFTIIIFNLVYFLFADKNRQEFRKTKYFVIIVTIIPAVMLGAFWYTSIGIDSTDIIKFAVGYGNEYENNFHELITHFNRYFPHGYLGGKILFGDTFYPFIPRILWPEKPMIFGDLYLSYIVFPDATLGNTGAPSFGPLGQPYADFGFWGTIVQILIEQSVIGYFLGRYEIKCLNNPTIINFLLFITLAFGGLIGISSTDRLLLTSINVLLVLIIFWPLKYKFVSRKLIIN